MVPSFHVANPPTLHHLSLYHQMKPTNGASARLIATNATNLAPMTVSLCTAAQAIFGRHLSCDSMRSMVPYFSTNWLSLRGRIRNQSKPPSRQSIVLATPQLVAVTRTIPGRARYIQMTAT